MEVFLLPEQKRPLRRSPHAVARGLQSAQLSGFSVHSQTCVALTTILTRECFHHPKRASPHPSALQRPTAPGSRHPLLHLLSVWIRLSGTLGGIKDIQRVACGGWLPSLSAFSGLTQAVAGVCTLFWVRAESCSIGWLCPPASTRLWVHLRVISTMGCPGRCSSLVSVKRLCPEGRCSLFPFPLLGLEGTADWQTSCSV